jgi:hypothetical protein
LQSASEFKEIMAEARLKKYAFKGKVWKYKGAAFLVTRRTQIQNF